MVFNRFKLRHISRQLNHGATIAYPTEGVYGLGCLPDHQAAIKHLLQVKNRPWQKGMLLVGSDLSQFAPYILQLNQQQQAIIYAHFKSVLAGKSHPTTWIVPAKAHTSELLRGQHSSIGIRLCTHPLVQQICQQCQSPLVSSSANISKRPPARNAYVLKKWFRDSIDIIVSQATLGYSKPSQIKTLDEQKILRNI
jgi:L-threonylcarbamoyladenylate synthase